MCFKTRGILHDHQSPVRNRFLNAVKKMSLLSLFGDEDESLGIFMMTDVPSAYYTDVYLSKCHSLEESGFMASNKKDSDYTHRKLEIGGLHRKANNSNWYYRFTVNGHTKEISTHTDDIDEAEKFARKYMPMLQATTEEVLAGYVAAARKHKRLNTKLFLDNAWDVYSQHEDRAIPETVAERIAYKTTFDEFCMIVDNPKIRFTEITFHHAQRYADYLKAQGLAVDTHNRKIKRLCKIFNVLKEYHDGDNPFQSPSLRRSTREERSVGIRRLPFTKEQEMAIIEELSKPERKIINKEEIRLIYLIGMYTGQRLKDCVLLKWSSIDMERKRIVITQHKTGKHVSIPIAEPLISGLKEAWKGNEHGRDAYVTPNTAKRYMTVDSRGKNIGGSLVDHDILRPIRWIGLKTSVKVEGRRKAITEYGFHSLRHSFVSFCAEAGVPKSVVMSFTGTDSEIIDQYYVHVGEEQQSKALESLFDESGTKSGQDKISMVLDYIERHPENRDLVGLKNLLTA